MNTCTDTTCAPDWKCESCVRETLVARNDLIALAQFDRLGSIGTIAERPTFTSGGTGNTVTAERTVRWTKHDGGWALKGHASILLPGATVTVAKANGDTAEVTVGDILATRGADTIAAPAAKTTAATTTARWAKHDNAWVIRTAVTCEPGDTIIVAKANGDTAEVTLGELVATVNDDRMFRPAAKVATVEKPAPGFYRDADGQTLRVKENKERTGVYALVLAESGEWEYRRHSLTGLVALTVEEAAEYGHRTGNCLCCGRELTVAESIERGIGPVCLAKHF